MEEQKLFATNKLVAMHWLTQGYVLCNEIADFMDEYLSYKYDWNLSECLWMATDKIRISQV